MGRAAKFVAPYWATILFTLIERTDLNADMTNAVLEYEKLVETFTREVGVTSGQMFGKPCLKVHGKAFVAQHKETLVFKLSDPAHEKALATNGATLWDPSGKGRPMKEWVAIPATGAKSFRVLAAAALTYVASVA